MDRENLGEKYVFPPFDLGKKTRGKENIPFGSRKNVFFRTNEEKTGGRYASNFAA